MSGSLEQLQAQRALIQQHLDWLDRQIEVAAAAKRLPRSSEASAASLPRGQAAERPGDASTDSRPQPAAQPFSSHTRSELRRAKLGCLTIFTLASLLFIFLLFGLPYLIDTSPPSAAHQDESR